MTKPKIGIVGQTCYVTRRATVFKGLRKNFVLSNYLYNPMNIEFTICILEKLVKVLCKDKTVFFKCIQNKCTRLVLT